MGQDEDLCVIRRLVSPPSLPVLVGPRAPHRTEHVPSENPRPHARKSFLRDIVVRAGFPRVLSVHRLPHPGREEPLHQLRASDAERMLEILVGTGGKAIQRHREASYHDFCHADDSELAGWNPEAVVPLGSRAILLASATDAVDGTPM